MPRSKMPHVGTTIFTEMSALATECGALNIAQGFPDLPTPPALRLAVAEALEAGHNQYAPMPGNPALRRWIADVYHRARATTQTPKSPLGQAPPACSSQP